jgi:hypothetical protein
MLGVAGKLVKYAVHLFKKNNEKNKNLFTRLPNNK